MFPESIPFSLPLGHSPGSFCLPQRRLSKTQIWSCHTLLKILQWLPFAHDWIKSKLSSRTIHGLANSGLKRPVQFLLRLPPLLQPCRGFLVPLSYPCLCTCSPPTEMPFPPSPNLRVDQTQLKHLLLSEVFQNPFPPREELMAWCSELPEHFVHPSQALITRVVIIVSVAASPSLSLLHLCHPGVPSAQHSVWHKVGTG